MAITLDELVSASRELVTELPESVIFSYENIAALIPSAIALWQQKTNNDVSKRQAFIQESENISLTSVTGFGAEANILPQVDAKGFKLEFIKDSDIEIAYATGGEPNFTVKFVPSLDRLKIFGRGDKFFIKAYLSGTNIKFRKSDGLAFTGTMKIKSVVLPSDLTTLPASVKGDLALIVAELAKLEIREKNLGLNISPQK
jgi:hypothetical protein